MLNVRAPSSLVLLSVLSLSLALAASCTQAGLYQQATEPNLPNKVSFSGEVCTDNPSERDFPLRVVFLVDSSVRLPLSATATAAEVSAYQLSRVNAIRGVVQILRSPSAAFAMIRYGGQAFVQPDDGTFTPNVSAIVDAAGALTVPIPCSQNGDGCVRLPTALSLANTLITGDLLSTAKGPRSRTKYVVVLLSGSPADDATVQVAADCDMNCFLESRVKDMRAFVLANGGADFQLHAIDLGSLSDNAAVYNATQAQLEPMAFAGAGRYDPVCRHDPQNGAFIPTGCTAASLSLLDLGVKSAENVFLKKSFVVSNLNAVHTDDGIIPDSDADGLSDADEEQLYGTRPDLRDSDGDGISDKVEILLSTVGLNPNVGDNPITCDPFPLATRQSDDTDGDGMTDCEEALMRLDPTLFDSDADGAPDNLEVASGTNFLLDDALTDSDLDGTPNNIELAEHSDPRAADSRARANLSYLYTEIDLGIRTLNFSSQPFRITGVSVDDVSAKSSLGNGELSYAIAPSGKQVLAWRDPAETEFGPGVVIEGDAQPVQYTLFADCEGVDPCERSITISASRLLLPPAPTNELLRIDAAERQCTRFHVGNVTLVQTQATPEVPAARIKGHDLGSNTIRIFFSQVPAAVSTAFGIFRVAQFEFIYHEPSKAHPDGEKIPNVANIQVDDFDFALFE